MVMMRSKALLADSDSDNNRGKNIIKLKFKKLNTYLDIYIYIKQMRERSSFVEDLHSQSKFIYISFHFIDYVILFHKRCRQYLIYKIYHRLTGYKMCILQPAL